MFAVAPVTERATVFVPQGSRKASADYLKFWFEFFTERLMLILRHFICHLFSIFAFFLRTEIIFGYKTWILTGLNWPLNWIICVTKANPFLFRCNQFGPSQLWPALSFFHGYLAFGKIAIEDTLVTRHNIDIAILELRIYSLKGLTLSRAVSISKMAFWSCHCAHLIMQLAPARLRNFLRFRAS